MMPKASKKNSKSESIIEKATQRNLPDEKIDVRQSGNSTTIEIVSHTELSESEVITQSGLDETLWRIHEHRKWTTTLKLRRNGSEYPVSVWNYHYVFRRRAEKGIQDSVALITKEWKPPKLPTVRKRKTKERPHLVEIDLFDVHFGKLCWDENTNGRNYDLDVAADDFSKATHDLVDRTSNFNVAEWLFPIGNDFFQADNWQGTTTKGTPVANDDRLSKVFRCGHKAIAETFLILRQIAPVRAIWVPGNHDLNTSWHLYFTLSETFRSDKHVKFDLDDSRKRKYVEWGSSVIGFQHGDKMKPEKMVLIAPTEFPDWSRKHFREIHCGHKHTRQDVKFVSASEHSGTMVRYLAALSETDEWHYDNGYVGNKRAAEAVVWDKSEGPVGTAVSFVHAA